MTDPRQYARSEGNVLGIDVEDATADSVEADVSRTTEGSETHGLTNQPRRYAADHSAAGPASYDYQPRGNLSCRPVQLIGQQDSDLSITANAFAEIVEEIDVPLNYQNAEYAPLYVGAVLILGVSDDGDPDNVQPAKVVLRSIQNPDQEPYRIEENFVVEGFTRYSTSWALLSAEQSGSSPWVPHRIQLRLGSQEENYNEDIIVKRAMLFFWQEGL